MPESAYTCDSLLKGSARIRNDVRRTNTRRQQSEKIFELGTIVKWRPRKEAMFHHGPIVEILPRGRYPSYWKSLRVFGFYREIASYVVLAENGKHYWPYTIKLEKCTTPLQSSR